MALRFCRAAVEDTATCTTGAQYDLERCAGWNSWQRRSWRDVVVGCIRFDGTLSRDPRSSGTRTRQPTFLKIDNPSAEWRYPYPSYGRGAGQVLCPRGEGERKN